MASSNIFLLHHACFAHTQAKQKIDQEQEVDQENNSFLDDLFATLQTYQMEFDAQSPIGRLPWCFVREFGDKIDSRIILQDPSHNEFEVHVARRSRELYFDDGWFALRDAYDLWFGAWVTFAYVNPRLLTIRLTTRWGTEVKYPTHDPPLKYLLPKVESSLQKISSNPPVPNRCFVRSFTKEITFYDLHSGTLILPWYGFGEFVFEFAFSDLVLIDNSGDRYPSKLKFGVDPYGHLACKISGGWIDYCTVHGVYQGDTVRFSIMEPVHNYELYVSFYSPIGEYSFLD